MSREKLANWISDIFNPYYLSAPFFFIISFASSPTVFIGLISWLVASLFFSVLPVWDIHRRVRLGLVGDVHVSSRRERVKPFIFSFCCAVLGLASIYLIGATDAMKTVSWTVVITGAVITIITAFWKISLHAAGISSVAAVLIALYGVRALPVAFFVPVVLWARLTLKKHTPWQLLAGALVAAAIAIAVFWQFGLV
ncbi:MAG: hypothetical protein AB1743_02225 [Actinomycetota bacterium]